MKTYAFIPARANSKRVPGKNFKLLKGKPLIYWTIKAAIESNVDMVYFSTEDSRLLELANDLVLNDIDKSGIKFDVLPRSPKLSMDFVQTSEVYLDMLRTIQESPSLVVPDRLVLLQPTSPLRTAEDINNAMKAYSGEGTLISAFEVKGFYWKNNEPLNDDPRFRLGGQWIKDKTYKENGAIYITNAEQFSLYCNYRMPPYQIFEMDARKSIDIDTSRDFQRAAELINYL